MEVVKYGNRKLYSPTLKRYVTLNELINLKLRGQDVFIKCHKTKNDITGMILARAALPRLEEALHYYPENVAFLTELVGGGR